MDLIRRFLILVLPSATLALAALTVAGYLARLHWLFDILAHMRVQALLVAVVLTLALAVVRQGGWLWLAVGLLLANAVPIAPYYLPQATAAQATDLRVMTLNILRENRSLDAIVAAIDDANPDVVALLELTPAMLPLVERLSAAYPHQFVQPLDNHFGIALLSRLPLADQRVIPLEQSAFPMLLADVMVNGRALTLAAMHPVPPLSAVRSDLRNRQLALAAEALAQVDGPLIALGDFNATPFSAALRQFERATDLTNAARGHGLQPTWRARHYPFGLAIDHVLISAQWRSLGRRVGPDVGSDHFPVVVDLVWRD